jgi:glycosyltransferase involved in cell wall biosynthesis
VTMSVSVVIPTYNRGAMVTAAVGSVLAQTIGNVEIIVVDDGSTDDTARLLAPYLDRIVYIRTDNRGIARARNTGMQAAQGDYIAWLDNDDLYRPFKLALQCGLLDRHPEVGMVYTEFSGFDDAGFYDEWHLRRYHESAYLRGGIRYEELFTTGIPLGVTDYGRAALGDIHPDWLTHCAWFGNLYEAYLLNTIVFTNSMVFRRSLLDTSGFQATRFGLFHDLEFALRLCRAGPVAFVDVPTYQLRYHPGQISSTLGSSGTRILMRKQQDLLRVFRAHTRPGIGKPALPSQKIAQQTARLCRAVAMPMLACNEGSSHVDRYYPRRARKYLRACSLAGRPERLLWTLSLLPHPLRRVGLKLMSLAGKWSKRREGQRA